MWLATPASRRSERERQAEQWDSKVNSSEVGRAVTTRAAHSPAGESSKAGIELSQQSSQAETLDEGHGTLPATSVVKLWLVLDERARLLSVNLPENVVTGRGFKANGGRRSKSERAVAPEPGWESVGQGCPTDRWRMTDRTEQA
ncbi:unnamed protein product [Symbiodinium sp. CCMP2592]|nr:unnamed protein product [Symbiodinium sp. CCMP2592]